MIYGDKRIALLIDADNAHANEIDVILVELASQGAITVRHAYGDFTKPHLKPWRAVLVERDIHEVPQVAHKKGKNATDIKMVIGAMDLLHSGSVDAYALVSSDADFTPLAERLKEDGAEVYGFGDKQTSMAFRNACTKFMVANPVKSVTPVRDKQKLCTDPAFRLALRTAVVATKARSGWANLGRVRTEIDKHPFDLRGYGKFGRLMEATGLFEIRRVGLIAQVRVKPQA